MPRTPYRLAPALLAADVINAQANLLTAAPRAAVLNEQARRKGRSVAFADQHRHAPRASHHPEAARRRLARLVLNKQSADALAHEEMKVPPSRGIRVTRGAVRWLARQSPAR